MSQDDDARTLLRRFALALAVYREARGEPSIGKLLVAQTIENRVRDTRWPETYVGVITQPWQFSAFNRDDPNALVYPGEDDPTWSDCVAVADFILDAEPITTANHYATSDSRPHWYDASKIVAREGRHVFFDL